MDGATEIDRIRDITGYEKVGNHGAVKLCYWADKSLTEGRGCYKARFYGIESHRCLQMSPAADTCDLHCRFCWRYQDWEGDEPPIGVDDPLAMLEGAIEAQRRLLSGYGGDPRVNRVRWAEANAPRHVAISLTGEPTLYPRLSEFLRLCHGRGMTTFLVTNGMHPEALRTLEPLPTQLYCSVTAPNKEIFRRLDLPTRNDAWERLQESLEIIATLPTRRVVRHTLVKGWNIGWEEQFATLDRVAKPDFVEVKGFAFMGPSRRRLSRENVPTHAEVREFSGRLARGLGFEVADESQEASVVLLSPGGKKPEGLHFPVPGSCSYAP